MLRIVVPLVLSLLCGTVAAEPLHGIAMHGEPALPPDYKHFPYVNPDVKKAARSPMAWSVPSIASTRSS